MDRFARGRRLLLTIVRIRTIVALAALAACSPAKGEPVGVSNGGGHDHPPDAAVVDQPLAVVAPDFRKAWTPVAKHIASEHGGLAADVYQNGEARWAEDLFAGDAGVGVYVIDRGDGGVRFAVADEHGRTVADSASDAGASVEPCVRCHATARDAIFPIVP